MGLPAPPPSAEDFPPFHHIDPSLDSFRCIYYLVDEGRCCTKRIDKRLRETASLIKQRILTEPVSEARSALLQQFVESCCCKQYHRKRLTGTPLAVDLCERWEMELLGEPLSTPVRSAEGTPCPTPTNTRASARESHVAAPAPRANPRYAFRSNGPVPEPEEGTSAREFEPMKKKTTQTLAAILLKPLSRVRDREVGDIYAFSRKSSRGMVKIGYSKWTEGRLATWRRTCHYEPVLEHCVRNVPHMARVETLSHYELLPHWRRELRCKHNPLCLVRHGEWFECAVELAAQSMDNFSRWMIEADPYDADGFLKPWWERLIRKMLSDGQEVTSQSLLDAMEMPRSETEAPASAQVVEGPSPCTSLAPRGSTTTAAPRAVDPTSRDLEEALSAVARALLSLQACQIATLAALSQVRLVDDTRVWTPPNTRLPLVA